MKSYQAGAVIDATPARVWEVLTDGARYTAWDSGVEKLEGTIAAGQKVKVFSEISPGRAFPVKVSLDPRGQDDLGGRDADGVVQGRTHVHDRGARGRNQIRMREEFTGPLLGMIWRSMPDLQPSFDTFAAGLEAEAERTS